MCHQMGIPVATGNSVDRFQIVLFIGEQSIVVKHSGVSQISIKVSAVPLPGPVIIVIGKTPIRWFSPGP